VFKEAAIKILEKSAHTMGFLATTDGGENYNRVWSRDSAITAFAVCLHELEDLYPVVRQSILTLADQQLENGLIPSNVAAKTNGESTVSYGTLVGRVDAQTWWIIQTCLYLKKVPDEKLKQLLKPKVIKTLKLLDAWEFNNRHLIYTPLGGNWADEYVVSGYTLYDNLLRYMALNLFLQIWPDDSGLQVKKTEVLQAITINFSDKTNLENYQINPRLKSIWQKQKNAYFLSWFDSARYSKYWDAAANGLALLNGFQSEGVLNTINSFLDDESTGFIPSFWPPIHPHDSDWNLIEQQYNYEFKNKPYHFHNGGSWPVMTGILGLGLCSQGFSHVTKLLKDNYENFLYNTDNMQFSEYIEMQHKLPGGKKELCFSASGYLLLSADQIQIQNIYSL